jgi:hypothetical protein
MDKTAFNLSSKRKARKVGPRRHSSKAQATFPSDVHITVTATISTTDAIVPPLIIYSGGNFLENWTAVKDEYPKLHATITESGWTNAYMHMVWLERNFDPATKGRAGRDRRLLFLDNLTAHLQVDFLEACWARNIVCITLPPHMSNEFQPLNVNFFNLLKHHYGQQLTDYQLGTTARCLKGLLLSLATTGMGANGNFRPNTI